VTDATKRRGGPRPGAGRPADAGERRRRQWTIRVTDDEHERYEAAAEAHGVSAAEWTRDALDVAAKSQS